MTFRTCAVLAAHVAFAAPVFAQSAVPVEESSTFQFPRPAGYQQAAETAGPASVSPVPQTGGEGGNTQLAELFYQLQLLQREVLELRGMIEEQAYNLERLSRDQKDQYLDLDGRMQELAAGGVVAAPATTAPVGAPSVASVPGNERDAYTAAFDLMRDREFDASIQAFQAMLETWPNGDYSPNAHYWLGELNLARNDLEPARQSFMSVVNGFPEHQKVADALYKLGVTQHRLGDSERALEFLDRVQSEYPGTSAAGLAATYAAELR